jgi:dUTP pyrophosphatase
MLVNFKKLHDNAKLPVYATTEAAGADVYSVEKLSIPPGEHRLIKTGLGCSIPAGWEIQVRPRSGLALNKKVTVLNSPGTIDSDYTHELGVILINYGNRVFNIEIGDRIAQIVCAPVYRVDFNWTEEIKQTDRVGGFGSTGIQ